LLLIIFGIYVRSIPPKAPKAPMTTNPVMTPEETERYLQEAMKDGDNMSPEEKQRFLATVLKDGALKFDVDDDEDAEIPGKTTLSAEAPGDATEETTTTEPETNDEDRVEL
jgi:hypothetical protein